MSVQTGTVRTDRFSMDYCKFGSGDGTLVVLPGLSVQSVMPLADAIANAFRLVTDDFTVYVFDRRKGELPGTYRVRDMAEDTAEAMGELGIKDADIFGPSQGGMMAMEIAIGHPELVHKLVIGSSSAAISDDGFKIFDEWITLAKEGRAADLYLAFGKALYPEEVYESMKEAYTEAAKTVTDAELKRFIIMAESMRGFDIMAGLNKITCPVLVIGSKADRVFGGEASEKIREGLKNSPDAELYMYDGYGHAVYDLAPDYPERMLNFFKKKG